MCSSRSSFKQQKEKYIHWKVSEWRNLDPALMSTVILSSYHFINLIRSSPVAVCFAIDTPEQSHTP